MHSFRSTVVCNPHPANYRLSVFTLARNTEPQYSHSAKRYAFNKKKEKKNSPKTTSSLSALLPLLNLS